MKTQDVLYRLMQLEQMRSFGDFEDIQHAFITVWGQALGESLYSAFRRARGVVSWYYHLDPALQKQVMEQAAFRF